MVIEHGGSGLAMIVTFMVMVCSACSTEVVTPPLPLKPVDVDLTVAGVVGCYRTSDLTAMVPPGADPRYYTPPAMFRLSGGSVADPNHRIQAPPNINSHLRLTSWSVISTKELEATWTDGLAGVQLLLRRRSTDGIFYGRVATVSDGDGTRELGPVEVTPMACWSEVNRS
jgi:hypothetical protein